MKKKKQLTLTDALALQGVDNVLLARILTRNLRGMNALKAVDMIFKVRGDYKVNFVVSGQVAHAHQHLLLPPDEKQARIKALEERSLQTKNTLDILESIAPTQKTSPKKETVDG